jgi:predicted AAA+ superfamily ATPase
VFAISGGRYSNYGKIAESAVAEIISPLNYYRSGDKEIDFIWLRGNQVIPIEVKYGNYDIKEFFSIIKGLNLTKGIIVSKDKFGRYGESGIIVGIIPLWLFVLFPEKIEETF